MLGRTEGRMGRMGSKGKMEGRTGRTGRMGRTVKVLVYSMELLSTLQMLLTSNIRNLDT